VYSNSGFNRQAKIKNVGFEKVLTANIKFLSCVSLDSTLLDKQVCLTEEWNNRNKTHTDNIKITEEETEEED
jgi:uncharacterized cysteine cluster protein YcgN (CxxCxxCC family)